VSCVENPYVCGGSGGCAGAVPEIAFNYVQLYGLTSESAYPYSSGKGVTGTCSFDGTKTPAEVSVDGYVKLPSNDYNSLLYASATYGPIAISVDASNWHLYESGIFNGCSYTENIDVNHAVVLVGYGTDATGGYWLVRNSWGPTYGEDGYIRIARESTVTCGTDSTPQDGNACTG
jgi:cathepsin L